MAYFAGLDVSVKETRVCIVDDAGKIVREASCARAMRETAGSAAAPAARCRKVRRGSLILNLPLTSHHSITSSARASTDDGISSPSAFAVLRLITSSYL